jgi:hypothetical protein
MARAYLAALRHPASSIDFFGVTRFEAGVAGDSDHEALTLG